MLQLQQKTVKRLNYSQCSS